MGAIVLSESSESTQKVRLGMQFLADVLAKIFNFFFGCRHERLTRMFTLKQETYKVCLDCGSHIHYSLQTLRPLSMRELRRMRAAQAGEVRVVPAGANAPSLLPSSRNQAA
jgi:hypothetical protein